MNPILGLTALLPLTFLSNFLIAFGNILLSNPGKLYLAKKIGKFFNTFLPKLPIQEPKY